MPKVDGSESQQSRTATFAALVVFYGNDIGKSYRLNVQSLVIGRSSKCDVQVDQESLSRNHARIVKTGESWVIRDLGPTNGTYVNNQPIDEHVLSHGDLVKVGRTILKFLSEGHVETSYHDEMHRLAALNRVPATPSALGERTATKIVQITPVENDPDERERNPRSQPRAL
jgi:pSer/pThr/pTyr-binding forkhead associated (FHA) protein